MYFIEPRDSIHMKQLSILRTLRVARVARAIKIIHPLRIMVQGIADSLMEGVWALSLLLTIIFAFGMVFTNAALQYLYACSECSNDEQASEVHVYFGSMLSTTGTLFQAVTGGISYVEATTTLNRMGPHGFLYVVTFYVYVSLTYFVVLNVVTALFCQHAIEGAMTDQDALLENKMHGMQHIENKLTKLFADLDEIEQSSESPPGMCTFSELEIFLADPRLRAELAILGLETDDAEALFKLIDVDGDGCIETHAFISGCMRLRGEATKLDMQLLSYDLHNFMQEGMAVGRANSFVS